MTTARQPASPAERIRSSRRFRRHLPACLTVFAALVCLIPVAESVRVRVKKVDSDRAVKEQTMTRAAFSAKAVGNEPDAILSSIGKPDSEMVIYGVEQTWVYRGRTVNPANGKADLTAMVHFDGGKARTVIFFHEDE